MPAPPSPSPTNSPPSAHAAHPNSPDAHPYATPRNPPPTSTDETATPTQSSTATPSTSPKSFFVLRSHPDPSRRATFIGTKSSLHCTGPPKPHAGRESAAQIGEEPPVSLLDAPIEQHIFSRGQKPSRAL